MVWNDRGDDMDRQLHEEKNKAESRGKEKEDTPQERFTHTCYPIFDAECRVLILGTFPSVKSRETMFYYGHPQNRFWKVLPALFGEERPETPEQKKQLLLRNHVALWDVIESCEVTGSSDNSIRNVIPNDITKITKQCTIRAIYGNGEMSVRLYNRYLKDKTGMEIVKLPSTSPANASYSLDRLIECWSVIRDSLEASE